MDAYDIFKKLTKGLTFKHRVLGVKNNVSIEHNLIYCRRCRGKIASFELTAVTINNLSSL